MAMFVVLSVFSGLKDFSLSFTNDFDPQLKVESNMGKTFFLSEEQEKELSEIKGVQNYSKIIEEKAQNVLDVRASFPNSSLADLYNPLTMPPALVKAHNELDKAVDAAYSKQAFTSEAKRMEFLFELYEKYTAGLFVKEKKSKK